MQCITCTCIYAFLLSPEISINDTNEVGLWLGRGRGRSTSAQWYNEKLFSLIVFSEKQQQYKLTFFYTVWIAETDIFVLKSDYSHKSQ